MASQPNKAPGFLAEIRVLPWLVKLIIVATVMVLASPLTVAVFGAAYTVGGPLALVVVVGLSLWGAGWVLFTRPQVKALPSDSFAVRYCESCGERFEGPRTGCPQCGYRWRPVDALGSVRSEAALLNAFTAHAGLFDRSTFNRIRLALEASLQNARLASARAAADVVRGELAKESTTETHVVAPAPAGPASMVSAASTTQPGGAPTAPTPPVPRRAPSPPAAEGPPGPTVGDMGRAMIGWAAERQADILLYVGAFLLSVAAIIFVAYQGDALSSEMRFAILTGYALAFLGFGVGLHRWERVKEAGPAFLALGAVLVPIDFVMLRTQVLSEDQVATDVLVFFGAASSAALYCSLALRGYGKWYAVPAVAAALLAWGALGSMLALPLEWYGPWFMAIAAPGYLGSTYARNQRSVVVVIRILALVIGGAALSWTHGAMGFDSVDSAALPAVYLVATGAIAGGLAFRRELPALAALPPMVSMLAAATWWSVFGLPLEWQSAFFVLAGLGYLLVAHFDDQKRAAWWAAPAAAAAALGLMEAHAAVVRAHTDEAALPVAYALAFIGAAGAFGRWRWAAAGAALPPLGAAALAAGWWAASEPGLEWYSPFVGLGALGYLALAHFDRNDRLAWWQGAASAVAALSLGLAHVSLAADVESDRAALPTAYGIILAGAAIAFVRWGWSWRVAPAALPALAGMAGLTFGWAAWDIHPAWYGAFAAGAGIVYLVLAHFDRPALARAWAAGALAAAAISLTIAHTVVGADLDAPRAALPATYGLVFVGLTGAFARWRWTEPAAMLPPAGAVTVLTSWWASPAGLGVEWYGAFAAAAGAGYLALGFFDREDRRELWRVGVGASGVMAISLAHVAVADDSTAEGWALPITYALVLLTAATAFARWRFTWRLAPGALPMLASMTAITATWAAWDPGWELYAALAAPAAAGYVALSAADSAPAWRRGWLALAIAAGSAALAGAHLAQTGDGAVAEALPLVYAELLAAAVLATARWRLAYRETVAALPLLAAGFGASLLWAAADMRLGWLPAWIAAAAVGYLIPAVIDPARRSEWRSVALVAGAGAGLISHSLVFVQDPVAWQLPATYGVLLLGWSIDALLTRDVSTLLPPALAAVFGASVLWAAGAEAQWWPYPAIGVAAAISATSSRWGRNRAFGPIGWGYSVLLGAGATLIFLPVHYWHPEHGFAAQAMTAALLAAAAIGARGTIARAWRQTPAQADLQIERTLLLQAAVAFLFGAGASLNAVAEVEGVDRAWVFAGLGLAGWALAAVRTSWWEPVWTFAPVGLAGMTIGSVLAAEEPGAATAMLILASAGPALAFAVTRRWTLLGIANSYFLLAVWSAWEWQDTNVAYLPLGYAAVALVEWAALTGLRKYTRAPREIDVVVTSISWVPWLIASAVAGLLLSREQDRMAAGESIVNTQAWGLAAAVLAMASASVVAEGLRLRLRWLWLAGSLGLLAALLMAIATFEPDNVQAYWAPIGAYLVGVGLTFRRSPEFLGDNVHVHEALMIAGALILVLPPAQQSFEPGGGKFGLELLGIGVGLLLVGLALHARWLVAAAVVTLTGVSLRLVTGGLVSTPYWLLFGIAGTVLIGFGLLVLLERERWDRFRAAAVRWWHAAATPPGPLGGAPSLRA